jgi:prepilin-type N-terminal cleavage/methylation domain-containing protein
MRLKIKHPAHKGFTLIEIMITVLIIAIVAAVATPSFMTWVNNRKIQQVATDIEGALKEAQSTANRKSIPCDATVNSSNITAVTVPIVTVPATPAVNCLLSGTRQIQGENSNLAIAGTGGASTTVSFTALGSVTNTQAFVIYRTDNTSAGTKRCVVISSGIGTIKSGTYTGAFPLVLSSPPTAAQVTTVSDACSAS